MVLQVWHPASDSNIVATTIVIFFMFVLPREWLGRQAATDFDLQLYVTVPVVQTKPEKIFEIIPFFLTLAFSSSVTVFHRYRSASLMDWQGHC
jgi:hypothetical protein